MLEYNFHSNFHHYFDRSENLNIFFSFNFINYLRLVAKLPIKFLNENVSALNDKFDINLYLESEDTVYGKVYIKKFDELSKISLFENSEISTFIGKVNVSGLKGTYRVSAQINYKYDLYDYVNEKIQDDNVPDNLKTLLYNLKLIMDQSFAYYEYNSPSIINTYKFESDLISFDKKKIYLSSLYDIYDTEINISEYNNFVTAYSELKKIFYNGDVPLTKYIDDKIYSLNGDVDKTNYLNSILRLLQNNDIAVDYKQMCYEQNIFKVIQDLERQKYKKNLSYETLSTSLTTTVCDNNLFAIQNNVKELEGSDILFVANFYNNIPEFTENEFWKDDITKIPIYLLDILSKCKIFYLSDIDKISASMSWRQLTNLELDSLNSGKYLCKINSDKSYVNDYLIENYFILVK